MIIDACADLPLPKQGIVLSRVVARLSYTVLAAGQHASRHVGDHEVERALENAMQGLRHRLGA
jgi:hypothetical protein